MLDAEARQSVESMMGELRRFVERRVRSPADVDDILQDVFVRMQRGLPDLRNAERFGPWLYRIVRNAITDRYRVKAREVEQIPDTPAPEEEEDSELPLGLTACIAPFVARLPSPYREAVTLVDLEGVTHKDAAQMLSISIPGVKSRVQRGRAKLRAMFESCCQIELDVRNRVTGYQCGSGGCGCS